MATGTHDREWSNSFWDCCNPLGTCMYLPHRGVNGVSRTDLESVRLHGDMVFMFPVRKDKSEEDGSDIGELLGV